MNKEKIKEAIEEKKRLEEFDNEGGKDETNKASRTRF